MEQASLLANKIERFRVAILAGIDGIVRASKIYVEAIDTDPCCELAFRQQFEGIIPVSAWANFEAVGRGWLHQNMLLGGLADRRKNAIVKRLPCSLQDRIFKKEQFELLLTDGDRLRVNLMDATPDQVDQICGSGHIRTLPEQRAWLEQQKGFDDIDAKPLPYIISKGKVTFRRGTTMSRAEIKRLLREL